MLSRTGRGYFAAVAASLLIVSILVLSLVAVVSHAATATARVEHTQLEVTAAAACQLEIDASIQTNHPDTTVTLRVEHARFAEDQGSYVRESAGLATLNTGVSGTAHYRSRLKITSAGEMSLGRVRIKVLSPNLVHSPWRLYQLNCE